MAQMVVCLLSKCEALSSNPNTEKKKLIVYPTYNSQYNVFPSYFCLLGL
jgi:hypothetical protein